MKVLGIDPDVKAAGWAVCINHSLYEVGVFKSNWNDAETSHIAMARVSAVCLETLLKQHHDLDLIVVESQAHRRRNSPVPPKDILKLAQVAGVIMGQCTQLAPTVKLAMPLPEEWKGQTPKPIHQARIFSHLGIQCAQNNSHAYPTGCKAIAEVKGYQVLNRGDWKHVTDGIGLALWGVKVFHSFGV